MNEKTHIFNFLHNRKIISHSRAQQIAFENQKNIYNVYKYI